MKKSIALVITIVAVLCFSALPQPSEKGVAWYTYGTGSAQYSDIQAERGVYFTAGDFGLVYPVYLHGIAAQLADENYSYTYRVYDLMTTSVLYEETFTGSSIAGYNIDNFVDTLILNRDFTISVIPESSGLPRLGHSEQTESGQSFYKIEGGNWQTFAGAEEKYEWDIYASMSNVNDHDAPKVTFISGLENNSDVDALITINVRDDSAVSVVYGEYDLGAGWVQFTMTASKTDYTYSGTIPGQPAGSSVPVRFYMEDEHTNSGYSSTYTANWTGGFPINVTISRLDSTVTLNWDEAADALQYYIYSQDDPYSEFALIDSTTSTTWNGTYFQTKKFFYVTAEVSSVPENFSLIIGGTFDMGDHFEEGTSNELPVHSVAISDFYMGQYAVTQKEWADIMGSNPAAGYGVGDNYPVYEVSWFSILKYCNLRSMMEGLTPAYTIKNSTDPADWGPVPIASDEDWNAAICNWSANGYRLPTEAEWEYAARGGLSGQRFPDGLTISHSTNGDTQANYRANSYYTYDVSPTEGDHPDYEGGTSPVGSFNANAYGLYDMAGNLYEWCWDRNSNIYYQECYDQGTVTDPRGPDAVSLERRTIRSGTRYAYASKCRVSYRNLFNPYSTSNGLGFRLARTP